MASQCRPAPRLTCVPMEFVQSGLLGSQYVQILGVHVGIHNLMGVVGGVSVPL